MRVRLVSDWFGTVSFNPLRRDSVKLSLNGLPLLLSLQSFFLLQRLTIAVIARLVLTTELQGIPQLSFIDSAVV